MTGEENGEGKNTSSSIFYFHRNVLVDSHITALVASVVLGSIATRYSIATVSRHSLTFSISWFCFIAAVVLTFILFLMKSTKNTTSDADRTVESNNNQHLSGRSNHSSWIYQHFEDAASLLFSSHAALFLVAQVFASECPAGTIERSIQACNSTAARWSMSMPLEQVLLCYMLPLLCRSLLKEVTMETVCICWAISFLAVLVSALYLGVLRHLWSLLYSLLFLYLIYEQEKLIVRLAHLEGSERSEMKKSEAAAPVPQEPEPAPWVLTASRDSKIFFAPSKQEGGDDHPPSESQLLQKEGDEIVIVQQTAAIASSMNSLAHSGSETNGQKEEAAVTTTTVSANTSSTMIMPPSGSFQQEGQELDDSKRKDEQTRMEEELSMLRSLIGNVAHDLKTPLHSVTIDLEMLRSDCAVMLQRLKDNAAFMTHSHRHDHSSTGSSYPHQQQQQQQKQEQHSDHANQERETAEALSPLTAIRDVPLLLEGEAKTQPATRTKKDTQQTVPPVATGAAEQQQGANETSTSSSGRAGAYQTLTISSFADAASNSVKYAQIISEASLASLNNAQLTALDPLAIIDSISATCSFMKMAINRSLDFTKASSGIALVPAMETFNLIKAIDMPVGILRHFESNTAIVVEPLPVEMCVNIISDKHWLTENLLCLLSNAVKYSNGGDVRVIVTLERTKIRLGNNEVDTGGTTPRTVIGTRRTSVSNLFDAVVADGVHPVGLGPSTAPLKVDLSPTTNARIPPEKSNRGSDINATSAPMPLSPLFDHHNSVRRQSNSTVIPTVVDPIEDGDDENKFVMVTVEDTGIGLSPEARKNLFKPFKQAQRRAGGTGLGLYSLSKRMEALHGGYGVDGRADGKTGSAFWFSFPYRPDHTAYDNDDFDDEDCRAINTMVPIQTQADAAAAATHGPSATVAPSPSASSLISAVESRKLRVLVVDDSMPILKVTERLLTQKGHTVETAKNGGLALDLLISGYAEHKYDIVLMDLQMPVMDGYEATRRFREFELAQMQAHMAQTYFQAREQIHSAIMSRTISRFTSPVPSRPLSRLGSVAPSRCPSIPVSRQVSRAPSRIHSPHRPSSPLNFRDVDVLGPLGGAEAMSSRAGSQRDTDSQKSEDSVPIMGTGSLIQHSASMESIPLQTRGVLRRIRKIPIIGMSANSDDVSREMALSVGMDSFVCKPFNWNDLQPLLHRYGIARTETSSSNISSRSNSLSVLGSRIASRVQSRRGSNNNLELLEHAATKVIAYNESMAAVPQSQSDGSTHAHHLNGSTAIENHYSRSGGGNGGTVSPIIEELNTGEPSSEEEYS